MIITISDIEKLLKNILSKSNIQSSNSVYEKIDGGYRLVIDFNNLFLKENNILYTKLIFNVDKNKIYLKPNKNKEYYFNYLFDINCNYKMFIFSEIEEFEKIFKDIIYHNKFGENLKILSSFIKSPSTLLNTWFSKNNVRNISAYEISLDQKYKIMPCEFLFFNFNINLNNQIDIKFSIRKESDTNFIYDFKIYDDIIKIEKPNLYNMIEIIGQTLKTKYI